MGALRRLDAQAGALGDALVVGVAVGEDRAKVARFVRNHGIPYAQLVDEHFALADTLEERSIPATLVVDRQGRIVHRGGSLDAASLAAFRRAAAAGDARASAAAASHPVNPSPAQSSAAPE
jgi:peroxiredoxin